MHVLVVGGTRFVGVHLTWRLLLAGHRVTLLNRGTRADPFGPRVERLYADRSTAAFADALGDRRFDAVVDFACMTARDAELAVATLVGRTEHYVMISTGQVYLVRVGCPRPAREADYEGPIMHAPAASDDLAAWQYGVWKREAEDVLDAAPQLPTTRLRLPMVNGERDDRRRVESYLWRLLDGGPILLPDGGTLPMRHVYGDDVARAIVGLLGSKDVLGQAYNLAGPDTPTLRELVEALAAVVGARPRFHEVSSEALLAAGLPPARVSPFSSRWMSFLDPARAVAELGLVSTPLREQLGRITSSFFAHPPAEPPASYALRAAELELGAIASRV
jgi:nucleoside-diphosphate-sugar epimerase